MCGLAGIVCKSKSEDALPQLQKAIVTLAHRGPGDEGFWCSAEGVVLLGHRRLCILDLTPAAAQPMLYQNRYTLVYNGEIYNYLELRKDLEAEGHRFASQSDTEVLVAAYAAWGDACLQKLDGMFAFAIWDEKEQTLFAARDRLGEKPFFYFFDGERFLFASEIKAFWSLGVEKKVNEAMLYNFLTLGYTTNPADAGETFYQSITKLPAAHSLTYSLAANALHTHCYWQVYIDVDHKISAAEAIEKFRWLFTDSIRKRLRSDVPIGTSLSGGLDSSAIVAFCAGQPAKNFTHQCFTASFNGFEKDEARYASLVAETYGLQHHFTTITAGEVPHLMEAVTAVQDEPFSSSSPLAQYKVFELAGQKGITVLLDGQGADEILAGYHKYYKWYWQELYRTNRKEARAEINAARKLGITEGFGIGQKLAARLPDFAAALQQVKVKKQSVARPDLAPDFIQQNKASFAYSLPAHLSLNGAMHYNTFVNGLEELLRLADRNSMAHSIELRLPFLNHHLVEFLFTLPPGFKIHQGWTKWLLRQAVEPGLPAEIVWRRDKVGYEPPQKSWMQHPQVEENIRAARRTLVEKGVLNKAVLNQKVVPQPAHAANSFHWRYWSASRLL